MSSMTKHIAGTIIGGALVSAPIFSHATNGMFLIGYGNISRGMGGTAYANPQDAMVGAVNPAAIHSVGNRLDVGADLFLPDAKSKLAIGEPNYIEEESRANTFLIPSMGGVMKFNRKVSFGFTAIGVGGGGSRYNTNIYNQVISGDTSETLGVNLMTMQMNPTIAYAFDKKNTIGASLVFSVQTFRAFGLTQFSTFTSDGQPLKPQGNDWSYGAGLRLGWLGSYMKDRLKLGVAGSTRIYMTEFDKYDNLFAEQGDLDTPPILGAGISFKPTDKITLAFDVKHIFYEDIASISNQGPNWPGDPNGPFPVSKEVNALGADDGLGFGWQDQTVYSAGIAYDVNQDWTVRAGWNYGESPIQEDQYNVSNISFNIVAPATVQHHLTLGGTYNLSKNSAVNFSYVHAFEFKQRGPSYIGSTQGEIGMSQNSFGASYSMMF